MKKRFLAFLLALVLCLGLFPVSALASQQIYRVFDKNGRELLQCTSYNTPPYGADDELTSFQQNGKWGYIDGNGAVVIPARLDYDWAYGFSDGFAMVRKNGKYGYIDRSGREVISPQYDEACDFENGRAVVKQGEWKYEEDYSWLDGKAGLIDKTGKVIIPFQYDEIYTYGDGIDRFGVVLNDEDGNTRTIGLADADGKLLIAPGTYSWFTTYEGTNLFAARVKTQQGDVYGVVDRGGKVVLPADYDGVGLVHNESGCAIIVEKKDGYRYYHGLFDANGRQLLPAKYDIRHLNGTNLLKIMDGQGSTAPVAIMDFSGRMVADFGVYSYMIDFAAGIGELIPVAKNGAQGTSDQKWGALDRTGKEVIPCTLDISVAYDGGDGTLSVVDKDRKYRGLMDQTGAMIVPMEYDSAVAYENVIIVSRDGKWGALDRTGRKTVLSIQYDWLSAHGDVILAQKDGKWGAFNTAGKAIAPITYDEAGMMNGALGLISVRMGDWENGRYGVFDSAGKEVLPVKYTWVNYVSELLIAAEEYDAPTFTDVPADEYYAEPVAWAVEKGITVGTTTNTFSPDETCSRAQILTFLWRAKDKPETAIANPFRDVDPADPEQYYAGAALWAYKQGLISGDSFGADAPCTRGDVVLYLWRLAGRPKVQATGKFTDLPAGNAELITAVAWAAKNGITQGTTDTTFSPGDTCTRGQIVTFLHRAYAN